MQDKLLKHQEKEKDQQKQEKQEKKEIEKETEKEKENKSDNLEFQETIKRIKNTKHKQNNKNNQQNENENENDKQNNEIQITEGNYDKKIKERERFRAMMWFQKKRDPTENFRTVIKKFKRFLIQKYVNRGHSVIDLCCGTGGDIDKYARTGLSSYLGIDVSESSIAKATEMAEFWGLNHVSGKKNARFLVKDLNKQAESFIYNGKKADLVSIQQAIHYLNLDTILKTINASINPGGTVLITCIDSEKIHNIPKSHPYVSISLFTKQNSFKNYISAKKTNEKEKEKEKEIDQKNEKENKKEDKREKRYYEFWLKPMFKNVIEKVVEKKELIDKFREYDFFLEDEYSIRSTMENLKKIGGTKSFPQLREHDWLYLDMQCALVFRKPGQVFATPLALDLENNLEKSNIEKSKSDLNEQNQNQNQNQNIQTETLRCNYKII